jgi:protein phosphatase
MPTVNHPKQPHRNDSGDAPTRATGRVADDSATTGLEVEARTVCGPVREENQDAALVWNGPDGEVMLVVADGMGGHASGRQAAETVVRTCRQESRRRHGAPWAEVMRGALVQAHAQVVEASRGEAMGATAVLAVVETAASIPRLHLAHVGDSRAYLLRGASLYRLTTDHSLVGRLVEDGLLSEDEAFGHPDSNVIHRALGQQEALEPELHDPLTLEAGDWLLLCSDGLHSALPDRRILAVLQRCASATEGCHTLVQAALDAGSTDNVTVVCLHAPPTHGPLRPTRPERAHQPRRAS